MTRRVTTRWLSDMKMLRLGVGLALLLFVGGDQPRKGRKIESAKDSMLIENSTEGAQLKSSVSLSPQTDNPVTNSSTEQPFLITTSREEENQRKSKLLLHLPRLEGETNVTFSDVQQEMVGSVEGEAERMVRIGDGKYVPFNSMTFSSRNQALQAVVTEAGNTSTRPTTVPWWKKLKNNKKKGNKNKKWWNKKNKKKNKFSSPRRTTRPPTRPTQRSTTSTTTRATRRPTKLSTTWFPLTFTPRTTKSADYFKRPVVHEDDSSKDKDDGKVGKKPADAVILEEHDDFAEEDNVLKEALVNSIFTNHKETEEETGVRQLPTLTEVAGLFDDFYSYAEYYPWKSDVEIVKKFFLKILEDFSDNTFTDRRKLMKFLQKKVYLYSRLSSSAMNKLILDKELLQRYNFIVTDLAKRKIRLTKSPTTKPAAKRDPSSEKPQHAHKNLLIMNNRVVLDTPLLQKVQGDKSVIDKNNRDKSEAQKKYSVIKNFFGQKRPVVDLGPYWSSERPALRPVQFYPQTSGWPESEQGQGVAINPMFGQKPFEQESELAELFASGGGETGTGNTSCRVSLPLAD